MTIEEINKSVSSLEEKLNEVKSIMSDINACSSDKSKTILLAAASKLTMTLTGCTAERQV